VFAASKFRYLFQIWAICLLVSWSCIATAQVESETESDTTFIQSRLNTLVENGHLVLLGARIESTHFLPAFYKRRGYHLAWTGREENIRAFSQRILASGAEGLTPSDYHASQIQKALEAQSRGALPPSQQADLDLMLTEALARYAYHLRFGKVDPEKLDPDWNLARSFKGQDPLIELQAVIDAPALDDWLDALVPQLPIYGSLKKALAKYQAIRDAGGWPVVAAGPTLRWGMTDARVPVIRQRLVASGDLDTGADSNSEHYDEPLKAATIRFQGRHGLEPDGVIGKQTLAEMNIPVTAHIDQIRVNLERARWVSQEIPDTYVIVDLAGFRASLYRDGKIVWDERAQIGTPFRKTPVFREDMTYLDLNPTWTIPPTILEKDILPRVKKDPDYLAKKRIRVLTFSGDEVDRTSIDWESVSAKKFPYMLRQDPGPNNALGRVKFMFPNPHFIYLHDTPSKELFARNSRAFSSGCIRVDNPYRLAELLLQDSEKWNLEKIMVAVDTLKRQTVRLPQSVPVLLLYWTVNVDLNGVVVAFKKDLYQRDARVLAGLDGDFVFNAPADAPAWLK